MISFGGGTQKSNIGISKKNTKRFGRIRNTLDRPVTLWDGSATLWDGSITLGDGSATLWDGPQHFGMDPQHFGGGEGENAAGGGMRC